MKYNIFKSFYYASSGVVTAFSREPNLSIQLITGLIFTIIGVNNQRYVLAMANFLLMAIVISLEMINSCIEAVCDLVEPNYNTQVKMIKDMAAGAVMIISVTWIMVIIYQFVSLFYPNILIDILNS